MADIPIVCGEHLACSLCIFLVFYIKSDVLRENVRHGVQNVGHVRMSDDFSYTLVPSISPLPAGKSKVWWE